MITTRVLVIAAILGIAFPFCAFAEGASAGDAAGETSVARPNDAILQEVKTPEGRLYKDYDSLRKFLERNEVQAYQKENATAGEITAALNQTAPNGLTYWQAYAMGDKVFTDILDHEAARAVPRSIPYCVGRSSILNGASVEMKGFAEGHYEEFLCVAQQVPGEPLVWDAATQSFGDNVAANRLVRPGFEF